MRNPRVPLSSVKFHNDAGWFFSPVPDVIIIIVFFTGYWLNYVFPYCSTEYVSWQLFLWGYIRSCWWQNNFVYIGFSVGMMNTFILNILLEYESKTHQVNFEAGSLIQLEFGSKILDKLIWFNCVDILYKHDLQGSKNKINSVPVVHAHQTNFSVVFFSHHTFVLAT